MNLNVFVFVTDGEVVPEYIRRSEDLEEMGPDHPLHSLVCKCFENIPEKRPSAAEIIENLLKVSKDMDGFHCGVPDGERVGVVSSTHYDYKFKVLVLGEAGVGKTSIITRFLDPKNSFPTFPQPSTIDTEDHFERLRFRNNSVHLHLVDVGDRRFSTATSFVPQIFRRVRGAVVVFDVTSEVSFLDVRKWLEVLKRGCQEGIPVVLVGNKIDDPERWVNSRVAHSFAESKNMFYMEASAKTRDNIDEIFSVLMDLMIRRQLDNATIPEQSSAGFHHLASMRSLVGGSWSDEEALISERHLTPRRDTLDHGVIVLDEKDSPAVKGRSSGYATPSPSVGAQDQTNDGSRKSWCCILI